MSLEDIEKAICEAGSDNHEIFGGIWTGGYLIQQDPKEFAQLIQCLEQHAPHGDWLSIGIAAGGNERFIFEQDFVFGDLFVIDNGEHPNHKHWAENKKAIVHHPDSILQEFIGDSHSQACKEWLESWSKFVPQRFAVIGIDGDHSPEGVLQDWELVQPYLAPGAIVWVHDIRMDIPGQHGARKLWQRLKTQYEVLLETDGKCGIGVLRVP